MVASVGVCRWWATIWRRRNCSTNGCSYRSVYAMLLWLHYMHIQCEGKYTSTITNIYKHADSLQPCQNPNKKSKYKWLDNGLIADRVVRHCSEIYKRPRTIMSKKYYLPIAGWRIEMNNYKCKSYNG